MKEPVDDSLTNRSKPVEPLVNGPLNFPSVPVGVTRCQGVTRKGVPCSYRPVEGRAYCKAHDPNQADERKRQASELGKQSAQMKKTRARPDDDFAFETYADVKAELKRAQGRVRRGEPGAIPAGHVTARICSVTLESIKTGEHERLIEEIQQRLALMEKKR